MGSFRFWRWLSHLLSLWACLISFHFLCSSVFFFYCLYIFRQFSHTDNVFKSSLSRHRWSFLTPPLMPCAMQAEMYLMISLESWWVVLFVILVLVCSFVNILHLLAQTGAIYITISYYILLEVEEALWVPTSGSPWTLTRGCKSPSGTLREDLLRQNEKRAGGFPNSHARMCWSFFHQVIVPKNWYFFTQKS